MGVTIYKRMLAYVRPHLGKLFLGSVFVVFVSAFQGAIAFLVQPALDDIFIKKDASRLSLIPLLVLGAYLLKGLFEFAHRYLMNDAGQRVIRDIRDDLYSHMQSLSLSFFTKHPTGMLISRVMNDVGLMQAAVTEAASNLVKEFFAAAFLVGVVFYRDWKLAFVALFAFPLAVWPIIRFGEKLRKRSWQTQEVTGGLTTHLQETISGAKLVKASGAERREVERFTAKNAELFRLTMKVVKVQALTHPLSEVFAGIGIAAVIYYGGYSVVNGHSTPGNFFSFMTALLMLYGPVKRLSTVNNTVQQGIAAGERVFSVMDTLPEIVDRPGARPLEGVRSGIAFEGVGFRYSADGPRVLSDITIEVPSGTMVAIVGSSGAGKTTLVDLIPRFYDPEDGSVRIDGTDIRELTLASLRAGIGIVGQHTILFNDTLRNNIAYGIWDAPQERIEEASRLAGAHGFISRLKEGYDTVIGEQGMMLSGGERQRVAIARALLKDAPILILDEATSALDTESERLIQSALDTLVKGRTTFVIAHRLSTVRNADVILVIENGRIVERGRHEELLARESRYRAVYLKQFEEKKPGAGNPGKG
ncbi:MAG: ABC transporter ATP-binding protein [Thermodesulfobacteriota bacterium]